MFTIKTRKKVVLWISIIFWLKNFLFDFQLEDNRFSHVIDWVYGNLLNEVKKVRAKQDTD